MQQQQEMDYDLLAVFNNQSDADNAETKLHTENYGDDEVFRLASSAVVGGQFREHGPDRDRSSVFLQTTRQGPNPATIILLAIVFGLILGGVMFGVADFAIQSHPILLATLAGVVVGIILCVEDLCVEQLVRTCRKSAHQLISLSKTHVRSSRYAYMTLRISAASRKQGRS